MPSQRRRRRSPHGTAAWRRTTASQSITSSSLHQLTRRRWPVIVAIILGGIIAFSVVFCIARCICCGAECAICCCKCCSCCAGGSDRGHKRMKSENQGYPPPQPYPQQPYSSAPANPYAEARSFAPPPPPPPQINTQYQSHAAPTFTPPGNPNFNPQTNPKFARPASPVQPQFATFDAHSKPVNEDALPAMPSWKDARDVHVEVEEAVPEKRGDVEMDRLNHNGSIPNTSTGVAAAGGLRGSPGPARSPVSPVHNNAAYSFPQTEHDRRPSPAQNLTTSPAYAAGPGYPQNDYARGPSPAHSYSQYSQASSPYDRRSPGPNGGYEQSYNQSYNQNASQPYNPPPSQPYNTSYSPTHERYASPAPPSYHTTANPYAYSPVQVQDQMPGAAGYPGGGGSLNGGGVVQSNGGGYDNLPLRSQTASPAAYPGQQAYQAFQPGVQRKAVEGSARDV